MKNRLEADDAISIAMRNLGYCYFGGRRVYRMTTAMTTARHINFSVRAGVLGDARGMSFSYGRGRDSEARSWAWGLGGKRRGYAHYTIAAGAELGRQFGKDSALEKHC